MKLSRINDKTNNLALKAIVNIFYFINGLIRSSNDFMFGIDQIHLISIFTFEKIFDVPSF